MYLTFAVLSSGATVSAFCVDQPLARVPNAECHLHRSADLSGGKRASYRLFCHPLPLFSQIEQGTLVSLLDDYVREAGEFAALWPTSR